MLMGVLAGAMILGSGAAFAEPQPNMQEAMGHLQQAKAALERAEHDKGGHREKALEHVNQAIHQVQVGIDFANKH
jgi:hypothetical protein